MNHDVTAHIKSISQRGLHSVVFCHSLPEECSEGKCGVGHFSPLVFIGASLVSQGRLPVLARQLSGQQDC